MGNKIMSAGAFSRDIYSEQRDFSMLVRSIFERNNIKPCAYVKTYGCQQNVSDGEKIKGALSLMGYEFVDSADEADLVLYNTCAIREHAEDRIYGNVGALKHYKRRHPDGIVALCGCMTQQEHVAQRIKKSFPYVDLLFGTSGIPKLPEYIYRTLTEEGRVYDREGIGAYITEGYPIKRDSKIKAWLPIMYGCDNFCSYCIVPYVRGRERSRDSDSVIAEARDIVSQGYKDITLLGQNVNSYGKGLDEDINFADLLKRIDDIDGDFRIRFMTSHPKDCTKKLLDAMAECDKAAKHLHLPFQSGNDRILKAMNRRYDRESYLSLIDYARSIMPDLSITSDVIVGFPGETYEEFKDTLDLVKDANFTSLYTFIFSPRKGTPAAEMRDDVSREEKSEWFNELCALQEKIASARTAAMEGKIYKVLVEEETKPNSGIFSGRTEGNIIIEFPANMDLIGEFCQVRVTKALTWILKGEKEYR